MTDQLTKQRRRGIYDRLKATTSGQWIKAGVTLPGICVMADDAYICHCSDDHVSDEYAAQVSANFEFIAHAKRDIELLLEELSLTETLLCEARGGHKWEHREPDGFCERPWKECTVCGAGMMGGATR